jgi:hypothetical protein
MTRRRTPQEKKQDEYAKDHSTPSSHGFRQSLPREKARANRAYRRKVNQRVATFEAYPEDPLREQFSSGQVRRERVWKMWGVEPMGDVIKRRREEHVISAVRKFLKEDYDSVRDQEKFAAFLSSQVGGRTENSRILASCLSDVIDPKLTAIRYDGGWLNTYGGKWLRAFFQDEPEWEERLRTWIASFEQE